MANIFIDIAPTLPPFQGLGRALPSAQILVGNAQGIATAVPVSGDLSMSNTGVFTVVNIGSDISLVASSSILSQGTLAVIGNTTLAGLSAQGTTGGGSAAAGIIGEYATSSVAARGSSGTTGQYSDMVALTLTPGDWDITGMAAGILNGATITAWETAITSTSGNSNTGFVNGDNYCSAAPPTAGYNATQCIANWRRNITTTTTYYYKSGFTFAAGQGQYQARISARRIR